MPAPAPAQGPARKMSRTWYCLSLVAALTAHGVAAGDTLPSADGVEFFEKRVRPVLVEHCYACHSTSGKQKGNLFLDSRDGVRKGGDSGPAIVPGKPAESLLLKAVSYGNEELQMPPQG